MGSMICTGDRDRCSGDYSGFASLIEGGDEGMIDEGYSSILCFDYDYTREGAIAPSTLLSLVKASTNVSITFKSGRCTYQRLVESWRLQWEQHVKYFFIAGVNIALFSAGGSSSRSSDPSPWKAARCGGPLLGVSDG